jgi:chemotaxis protein CheX
MDCVQAATQGTFSATCGLSLSEMDTAPVTEGTVMIAVISLVGDLEWSVYLAVPKDTAVRIVSKFCGFEIPFDSADMSDAVGELTNIFAGQVKSCLDQKGVSVEISLPSVLRADNFQMLQQSGAVQISQAYQSEAGTFCTGVMAAAR